MREFGREFGREFCGTIEGRNTRERATLLAGALAEAGVKELILGRGGAKVVALRARETDLPGLLIAAAVDDELATPDRSLRVTLGSGAWTWTSTDATIAARLSAMDRAGSA